MVSIAFSQNINEEIFKVEYLIKHSQYFGNLAKAVMSSHNKTFFSKFYKVLVELNDVFNFEKFLIYVCQNLIETLYVPAVTYIS